MTPLRLIATLAVVLGASSAGAASSGWPPAYAYSVEPALAQFSPDARVLAVPDRASVRLIDTTTWQENARLEGELTGAGGSDGFVRSGTFSPDGRRVLVDAFGGAVTIWDVASRKAVRRIHVKVDGFPSSLFSPDGRKVVTAGAATRVWDAATGRTLRTLPGGCTAAFSPDGTRVLTTADDESEGCEPARVWTLTWKLLHTLHGSVAAFSPDGARVVDRGPRSSVVVSARSWKPLFVLPGRYATYSPDGRWIVTSSSDGAVRIWEASNGKLYRALRGHTRRIETAAFSPDARRLVTSATDGSVRVWDVTTGRLVRKLPGETGETESAMFSPDGRLIRLHVGRLYKTEIRDAATGRRLATFQDG